MWKFVRSSSLMVALALSGIAGIAQSTNSGDISGIVTDTSGAAIPGATVTVLNIETGVSKDYITNNAGVYDTNSIVAGNYKMTFSKTGFAPYVRSSITIIVGNTAVNAQLAVGSVTAQVVVNTDLPLLETETGAQSTTLDAETLSQLPQVGSVGQDWSSFNILMAGAAGAPMGNQGAVGSGTSNGTMLAVNGNLPFSTVLADGAETTLPASANSDIDIQETIQEVQTSTSAFSAQYGVGGILYNQITKGGSNRFHGSAYEYLQNTALNADNYTFPNTTPSAQAIHFHEFGGSVGGPIIKNKFFFFFDYEHIINNGGTAATSYNVPTAAELAGDFSGTPTIYDPATTTLQQTGQHTYSDGKTFDCSTASPCVIRTPFAGNVIPASRIDQVAKAIQAYFPAPNAAGTKAVNGQVPSNYVYTAPNSNPFTKFFGRLDYDVTSNNRLTGSVTEGDNPGKNFGPGLCPINCQSGDVSRVNSQLTDVWSINSHMTNEARIGYTNQLNFFVPYTLDKGYPAKLGWQFAKADNFPNINITNFTNNAPNGNTVVSSQINAVYKEHAYDPSDVVTLIAGKHILHFGGEFLIYQNNSTAWGNVNAGTLSYTGTYSAEYGGSSTTGNSYADFLLGQTQNWNARNTPEYGGREKLPQMFIQDDWKIRPNLTVNLGLRYQIQTGWSETKGNESSFDPTVMNPATNTLGAIWYGSTHANGRTHLQKPVYTTVLPRVGFAYSLNPLTTIRGGFGLYSYNWSNDTYGGGMGQAFGSQGNVADQTNGITPVAILSGTGSNLPYVSNSTAPDAFNGQNGLNYNAYHEPVGGSYQWNVQVQRQLNANIVASLAYVGNHGHNLPFPVDINQVPVGKLAPGDQVSRPYPQFGSLNTSGAPANENAISNYNSLQATIEKRMSQGVSFSFNYVWSHFLDDLDSAGWGSHSGDTFVQNSFVPSANYGNSNFDIRHAVKGDVIYQLPFGRGRQFLNNNTLLDEVVGGWQLASTIIVQSGQPFTAIMADGTNSYSLGGNNFKWFPNVIGNPKLGNRGPNQWFNEAAFAVPASGTFGNERRNQLTGPSFSRVNLSLGKTFAIREQYHLQVRADANNGFNHPGFSLPNNQLNVTTTGAIATGSSTITSLTDNGRTMQLTARFSF